MEEIIIDGVNVAGCEFLRHCVIPDNEGCKIDDSLCCDVGNCYYKQLKRLEQKNAELKAYKDVNEDFKTAWAELKAENERLKEEKDGMQILIDNYITLTEKYQQTLQEIKGVVTALYMNNWLQMNETARKSIQHLQDLITKAEEEWK